MRGRSVDREDLRESPRQSRGREAPPSVTIGFIRTNCIASTDLPVVRRAITQPTDTHTQAATIGFPVSITGIIVCRIITILVTGCTAAAAPAQREAGRLVGFFVGRKTLPKRIRYWILSRKAPPSITVGVRCISRISRPDLPVVGCATT